ncbi:MAG: hypothetical protein HY608_10405 [Planctomycetes bacterium]|nr:hypothetical protein [Planctomycetota bacterium]
MGSGSPWRAILLVGVLGAVAGGMLAYLAPPSRRGASYDGPAWEAPLEPSEMVESMTVGDIASSLRNLDEQDPYAADERLNAAKALAMLGSDARSAAGALAECVADWDEQVETREHAVDALGSIRTPEAAAGLRGARAAYVEVSQSEGLTPEESGILRRINIALRNQGE